MKHFEFYKELYHKENERRQEILSSLNIPIAVITALATGIYYFITTFEYNTEPFLKGFFILLISFSLLSLLLSIYYLIRAFSNFTKGYEYTGIPYVKELFNWYKELEDYYGSTNKSKKHFESFLIENMVKHIDHNMYVNDKKHGYIYKSKKFLVISLVFSFIVFVPYGYNYFRNKENIYKFELLEKTRHAELNDSKIMKKLDFLIKHITLNQLEYEQQRQITKEADTSSTFSSER